ncbi:hypothetical protein TNCV_4712531 [Trichonephila clavipes]|nr:hypothetical protein TNCV_4712531 [Trichonephila clavipes]
MDEAHYTVKSTPRIRLTSNPHEYTTKSLHPIKLTAWRTSTLCQSGKTIPIDSAGLSIGDKLDLARFSGYKFRSSNAKGAYRSSAPRARNELKSALPIEYLW